MKKLWNVKSGQEIDANDDQEQLMLDSGDWTNKKPEKKEKKKKKLIKKSK